MPEDEPLPEKKVKVPDKLDLTMQALRGKYLRDRANAIHLFPDPQDRELERQKLLWELYTGYSITQLRDADRDHILKILDADVYDTFPGQYLKPIEHLTKPPKPATTQKELF